jgi:hypothetical protein
VRAFRHAFLLGYADTIGRRIREAQQRSEQSAHTNGTSTALVLADRQGAVDRAVNEIFPRLRTLRASASSAGGLIAGRAAGGRADLTAGRNGLGAERRQLQ